MQACELTVTNVMQREKEGSGAVRDNPDHLSAIESLVSNLYTHCCWCCAVTPLLGTAALLCAGA